MRIFEDPAGAIHVAVDEVFAVRLAGNPTTGYIWQAGVEARHLALVDQVFEPGGPAAGAAGHQVCHFRALAPGRTEIAFEYRRPWESQARDTRSFEVIIG